MTFGGSARLAVLGIATTLLACGTDSNGTGGSPPAGGPPPAGVPTEIIDAHNLVRAGATPTPSPALAPLAWSASVASTAQAWADGCVYQHNPNLQALSLGENIAAAAPPGAKSAAQIVGLWASEQPFYDYATNTCDAANPANVAHTCGHYTQIVWRSTSVVGCGMRTCTTGSPFGGGSWDFWVCDYAPPRWASGPTEDSAPPGRSWAWPAGPGCYQSIIACALAACAGARPLPDAAGKEALAPTGRLRMALYPGTPTSILDPGTERARGVATSGLYAGGGGSVYVPQSRLQDCAVPSTMGFAFVR